MAIRYDKNLNKEINKTIKNFNQKIARLEREEKALFIPNKITKRELTESYTNRTDLRRKLKDLKSFSERGAEKLLTTSGGVIISQYELGNIKRERRRILYNINRDLKKLGETKVKVAGKIQDVTFRESADENYLNKLERYKLLKRDLAKMTPEQFERYKNLLGRTREYQSYRDTRFYNAYLNGIMQIGRFYNVDESKLKAISQKFYELDPDKFLEVYDSDKAVQTIMTYYANLNNMSRNVGSKSWYDNFEANKKDVNDLFTLLYENLDSIIGE